METVLKIVRVFIGSPGGLEAERQAAKSIVEEINQNHSEHWGCQIKLVGWEITLPGYSRAQCRINQDLDKCDYFIGVLWDHWGSKPADGDCKFTSGFHEEYERAIKRLNEGLMKDIALFFKDIDEKQLRDPGNSLRQVLAFREKCIKERKPLFKEFKATANFEPLFRASIEAFGWREFKEISAQARKITDPEQPNSTEIRRSEASSVDDPLIGRASAQLINQLLGRSSDWSATDAFEVARFRLIANSLHRQGNDKIYLGNHDANLLFMKRYEFDFDEQETRELTEVGIAGFNHQNVPLWHWLSSDTSSDQFWRARILSVIGNDHEMINAIRILQCTGQRTPEIGSAFTRENILKKWLLEKPSDTLYATALSFLNTNGEYSDAEIFKSLIDDVPPNRKNAASNTLVVLLAAHDLTEAFVHLINLNPDTFNSTAANALFGSPDSIPTATAEHLLALKANNIRRTAAELLNARHAIDVKTAEKLMVDADPEVRLIAVDALLQHGVPLQEETIKNALVQKRTNALLSLTFGGAAAIDESFYERYRKNRLSKLGFDELKTMVEASDALDHIELTALSEKYTGCYLPELRTNLVDGFKEYFERKIKRLISLYGSEDLVSKVRKLEDNQRKTLVSKSVNALCRYNDQADLVLIRKTLDEWDVDFSPAILKYLGRFGNWSDRNRVLAFINRYPGRRSLLSSPPEENVKSIASALYRIGKSRLIDILTIEVENPIRQALVKRFTKKDIASLSDDTLINQLNDPDDQFRRLVALKCAQSLTQARCRTLLCKYVDQQGHRYYNSIHWLDLGATMERSVVTTVVKFELETTLS